MIFDCWRVCCCFRQSAIMWSDVHSKKLIIWPYELFNLNLDNRFNSTVKIGLTTNFEDTVVKKLRLQTNPSFYRASKAAQPDDKALQAQNTLYSYCVYAFCFVLVLVLCIFITVGVFLVNKKCPGVNLDWTIIGNFRSFWRNKNMFCAIKAWPV